MVTTDQCIAREGGTALVILTYPALYCTALYCTVRGLDVTLAMICDWGEAGNGSGDYSPAINITTSSTGAGEAAGAASV